MKIIKNQREFDKLVKEGVTDFSRYIYEGTTLGCRSDERITSLPEMPNLEWLDCSYTAISNLPEMPKLEYLYCSNTGVTHLPEMHKIEVLDCRNTEITGKHFRISPTSGTSVYCFKEQDKLFTGCFVGTLEEFYQKGWIE